MLRHVLWMSGTPEFSLAFIWHPPVTAMTTEQTIEREFLPIRAKILEIAAALDRIERCEDFDDTYPQLKQIREGIETLLRPDDDRAEQVQLIFSRPYDDAWQNEFGVTTVK